MYIDSVKNGIVIDHIQSGKSADIINYLQLDKLGCSIAIIKNAKSNKTGIKDIIKIEEVMDVNFEVLGFIDPGICINVIRNDVVAEKYQLKLPSKIVNVVKCKNPRCITSIEQEIKNIFVLSDEKSSRYTCYYCDQEFKDKI